MANSPPSSFKAAIKGLCPRCGAKTLFQNSVGFAPKCRVCQLDFSAFNVGDGPAAFLVLIIGAAISGLAISLELGMKPPFWVHLLIWPPVTIIAVILSLRIAKAALLVLEYRNSAREGQIKEDE